MEPLAADKTERGWTGIGYVYGRQVIGKDFHQYYFDLAAKKKAAGAAAPIMPAISTMCNPVVRMCPQGAMAVVSYTRAVQSTVGEVPQTTFSHETRVRPLFVRTTQVNSGWKQSLFKISEVRMADYAGLGKTRRRVEECAYASVSTERSVALATWPPRLWH